MNKKIVVCTLILIVVTTIVVTAISINNNNKLPDDFIQVKRDIEKGITYDLCDISSNHYLQPEFYPSYETFKLKEHDYSRWGVHGFGAYPGSVGYSINNMNEGQTVSVCTFIHASFGVETFQGMKLSIISNSPELFSAVVEPTEFLLYPAFPDTSKNDKWAKKIKITIKAKEDIPAGSYDFQLKTISPGNTKDIEYREEMKQYSLDTYKCPWFGECDNNIIELRKRVYVSAGQFTASEFFKFNIEVNS